VAPAWFTVDAFLRDYVAWRPADRTAALPLRSFDGQPAGVVTVAALASVPPSQRHAMRAGDVAVPAWAVITTRPEEPVTGLLERLQDGSGIAVVVVDGAVVGLVTRADIVHTIQRNQPPGPAARSPAAPATAARR
jgi:CBS-domain-containing membrane protein